MKKFSDLHQFVFSYDVLHNNTPSACDKSKNKTFQEDLINTLRESKLQVQSIEWVNDTTIFISSKRADIEVLNDEIISLKACFVYFLSKIERDPSSEKNKFRGRVNLTQYEIFQTNLNNSNQGKMQKFLTKCRRSIRFFER